MLNKNTGLANIDNELYEICKDMKTNNILDNELEDGHITSDLAIMSGSIFPHGKYEDTEAYKNVDSNAFNSLLKYLKEAK